MFQVFADGSDFARSEGLLGVGQADPNGGELLQLTTLNHYVIKKVAVHSNGLFAIAMTYDGRVSQMYKVLYVDEI